MIKETPKASPESIRIFYTKLVHYLAFMKRFVHPKFKEQAIDSGKNHNIYGLFLRALAWSQSIERLNKPNDVQALVSAVRSLLEIGVDMLLLKHADEMDLEKYEVWKRSAKLNVALPLIDYFQNVAKRPIPQEHQELLKFCEKYKNEISRDRQKYWGTNNHPGRWTGNNDLRTDCERADGNDLQLISNYLGSGLLEYYQTNYRLLLWYTHGSSLVAFEGINEQGIYAMCGLAVNSAANFLGLIIQVTIDHFAWPELSDLWKEKDVRLEEVFKSAGILK